MTHDQIDKELEQSRLWKEGGSCFECSDYEGICADMKNLLHSIVDQAKAEQREIDAMVAENKKKPGNKTYINGVEMTLTYEDVSAFNQACDSIAAEIRKGKE